MALLIEINSVDLTSMVDPDTLEVQQIAGAFTAVCQMTLADPDANTAITAKQEVEVSDNVSGTIFFKGRICDINYENFGKDGRLIHLNCQDFNMLADEYIIDVLTEYAAEQDDVIIDDLFDTFAAGVIDSETFVAHLGVVAEMSFLNLTLAQAMNEICNRFGGFWYIDDQKKLHYDDDEATAAPWDLSDTPDDATTFSYLSEPDKKEDATQVVTRVLVVGAEVSLLSIDAAAEAALGDQFAAVVKDASLIDVDDVTDRGESILAKYSMPLETYIVKTFIPTGEADTLVAGMDIGFKCGLYDIDDTLTIRRITITWPQKVASYELELGDPIFTAANAAGGSIGHLEIIERPIGPINLPLSSRGWGHDLVFSSTDHNTVAWSSGTLTTADGTEYSIDAGNTGNMVTLNYIYLDIDSSVTVLQLTTSAAVAVGAHKCLIAVASPEDFAAADASFQVFGCEGATVGLFINADNIAANCITANEITANTITAAQIAAGAIETDELAAGAVTAVKIAAATITADKLSIGSSFYNAADGLMLFNGFSQLERVGAAWYWWSVGRQRATVTGAIHQVQGRWQGTRALVVEPGTLTNLITNPSFEVNVTDGWTIDAGGGAGAVRATHPRYIGSACMALRAGNANPSYAVGDSVVVANGETIVVSCWAWTEAAPASFTLQLHDVTSGITRDSQAMTKRDTWQYLEAIWENDTGVNKTCYFRFKNDVQNNVAYGYIDACMTCHDLTYGPRYFDGSMGNGYAWTGVANNSTSTRTKTTVNLNAYRRLVSGNANWSVRVVAQMPLNADDDWPFSFSQLLDIRQAADNNNRVYVQYRADTDVFGVYINGGMRCSSAAQTFKRGDWVDIVATFNFTTDDYNLYVEGVLVDNDGTVLAPVASPTLFYLGSSITAAQQAGYAFAEVAVFDRVLTAVEVAQMYNLQRPLVDAGTDLAPGIYIVDGKFQISSSTSGARIEIVADEIAGFDSAGTKQFYLQAEDGKAYCGGGAVIQDENGIRIVSFDASAGVPEQLRFRYDESGTEYTMGQAYSDWAGGAAKAVTWLTSRRPAACPWPVDVEVIIAAIDDIAGNDIRVRLVSDGNIYTTGADLNCDQKVIITDTVAAGFGDNWKLGDYTAFVEAVTGYIDVEINGTGYRLLCHL